MTRTPPAVAPPAAESGGESLLTVLIALGVNTVIAVVKSIVGAVTGSAAMVAEAAHSWADAGNEVFLLLAERRAAYVWSMVAAFGLFAVGSAVSVWHGITAWSAPEEEAEYTIAYIVLAVAFVLEGISFLNAHRRVRRDAERRHISDATFLRQTSDPTLRAVWVEDASALIGLA
ncbi:cation diffusion facilitator family transporter, partial [Streptomyces sp. NPDC088812]|uniref:cation diffusion facilitator family transporter n=1 Tax=Streptomyces sp. NPDC088812 TaxID=3365905 RepID=UPI0037FC1C1F